MSADNLSLMTLATEQTKRIDFPWATGNDAGGLSSSLTLTANTWYAVHLFTVGSTVELGYDTSATAANLIADHGGAAGRYRRVGWVLTDGAGPPNIVKYFNANSGHILWDAPVVEKDGAMTTTRETLTIQAPANSLAVLSWHGLASANNQKALLTDLRQADTTPSNTAHTWKTGTGLGDGGNDNGGVLPWPVDGSSQVGLRGTLTSSAQLLCHAYIDDRGI